ncbi:S-adenosyl-L-methionine-dependent methyltransferase [Syncephalis pseudoplumigaleata]|uniref:S-adenosyl-L-methionine-dependent methyltransferase n=1 Tax=Syncephalis pseudoplumigaleata TaxID=1712513 RepID=A0A4P9YZE4_9FUNG|nr:S-adenosyl-L-methionine-dependent methyltransferase [Syncephalis pseudoplumigaleata]|eukprot:RKP24781.1 S-adenosyl-L-methionine-dependent methyltransferase [Syncephalis pseudoplumigaleata]
MRHLLYERVVLRKPLQYILGSQPFLSLDLRVQPPTLIPRPETEEWTDKLATLLASHAPASPSPSALPGRRPWRILDLCTGTGCIALGLASSMPARSCHIVGIDKSAEAVELARENSRAHQSRLRSNPVHFAQMDLRANDAVARLLHHSATLPSSSAMLPPAARLAGYDLIVANPPYVTRDEYADLAPEVRNWEDHDALINP